MPRHKRSPAAKIGVLLRMARAIVRACLAGLFLLAGTIHLLDPTLFLPAMPPRIPFHLACIIVSGVCELLGGIGLLMPVLVIQRAAAWGLTALLIAVFPANIHMALAHVQVNGFPKDAWVEWARLPLQPLLVWAVIWSTLCLNNLHTKQ
jgi:uncharacterized membrane protein